VGNEVCDDGTLNGCMNDCTGANSDFNCIGGSSSTPSVCSCIKANSVPSGSSCVCSPGYSLTSNVCMPICGNGVIDVTETCDDGGQGGCLSNCTGVKAGYMCTSANPSVCSCLSGYSGFPCLAVCNDGMLVGSEVCDDGTLNGCKSDCTGANPDYTCTGGNETSPSVCTCNRANSSPTGTTCTCNSGFSLVNSICEPICGNGHLHGNEVCDDGTPLTGCLSTCLGVK
jgi:large repetitive protein